MQPFTFATTRTARYHLLGEPGPAVRHVWFCLAGHGQPVAELAAELRGLVAPDELLVLPEGLSRFALPAARTEPPAADAPALATGTGAAWFAPDSLLPDLADLTLYLDALADTLLAGCPPHTPVSVLGCGHGAAAACRWLAGGRVAYERLLLADAIFPADIDRRATLVALPERPVLLISSASCEAGGGDEGSADENNGADLLQDCLDVGLPARLEVRAAGTPLLAALTAAGETRSAGPVRHPAE